MTVLYRWWPGMAVDHLYEHCPGRRRASPELSRFDLDPQQPREISIDPDGTDICGWCHRVWAARNRNSTHRSTT